MRKSIQIVLLLFINVCCAQVNTTSFVAKPFQNNVFIEERGQFTRNAKVNGIPFTEKVFYAIEKADFRAYFMKDQIVFQFPEWKKNHTSEKEREEKDKKADDKKNEKEIETIWHTATMRWLNTCSAVEVIASEKAQGYYNYDSYSNDDNTRYDFVPAFKKITYTNLYPGVDAEFTIPEEGGIKYKLIVAPNQEIPNIGFKWEGLNKVSLDEKGNLHLKSKYKSFDSKAVWHVIDQAPSAFTAVSKKNIPINYAVENNIVKFNFKEKNAVSTEGIVIDPWLTNTSFPDLNRAYDIQEDSLGNVVIIGNHTNWQVQKYNSSGVLQWTYVTYAILMGDIAVDNPGNVYIVGGYSAGKRQKLDSTGVQQWVFSGLMEEWRLAFNYSKTILTEGGYFNGTPGDNIGQLDIASGSISNLMPYGAETRSIATDCNGDIYSLHVTFGYSGAGPSNVVHKTNANYTPGGSLVDGFLLAEAQGAGTGYGYNPAYSSAIYQVLNAINISGPYVFLFDGATLKQVDKNTLTILNSVTVPNGTVTMCGGVTSDRCGNIYVGSTTGIEKFNSSLIHQQSIAAPGAVYDLILSSDGNLLACGEGFVGSFAVNCTPPLPLTVTMHSKKASCNGGMVSVSVNGGSPPYSYLWTPGNYTTDTVTHLPVGTYTCTVSDPFCHNVTDTISILPKPPLSLTSSSTRSCLYDSVGTVTVNVSGGQTPYAYLWNSTPAQTTATAIGLPHGSYKVLIVDTDTCMDSTLVVIDTFNQPHANFSFIDRCLHDSINFANHSLIANGSSIINWQWDFGDGSTANTTDWNPAHLYSFVGDYAASLVVSSNNNCKDTLTDSVKVLAPPHANFTKSDVCKVDNAAFVDLSSFSNGSINSWQWNFGDSSAIDTSQNPHHLYSTAGTYDVTLISKNNLGCYDTVKENIVVHPMPQALFTPHNVCLGFFSNFQSQSTVVLPDNITLTTWNFMDGTSLSGTTVSHVFTQAASYNIQLLVTSNFGCKDSINNNVVINPLPIVAFTANDTAGCEPLCVSFTNASSVPNATVSSSVWNFGDGSPTSSSNDVQHCYTNDSIFAANYFSPILTITSDSGCVSKLTKTNYITVYPLPHAAFSVEPTSTTITNPVISVTDLSIGANTWKWNWGDSISNTFIQNPLPHNYADTGTYLIKQVVITQFGCKDSTYKRVIIEPDFMFYIPNAFTPDGDGINDTFIGKGTFIKEYEMYIFDRWGNLIYKCDSIDKPWDGRANKGNEIAQMDVYVYLVKVTDLKDMQHSYRGTVTLVK